MEFFTIFGSLMLTLAALFFTGDVKHAKLVAYVCLVWGFILAFIFVILMYSTFAIHPITLKYKDEVPIIRFSYDIGLFIYEKFPLFLKNVYNISIVSIIAGYFGMGLLSYAVFALSRINKGQEVRTKTLVTLGTCFTIIGAVFSLLPLVGPGI